MYLVSIFGEKKKRIGIYLLYLSGHLLLDYLLTNALLKKMKNFFFDSPHPWPFFYMHVRYYMYYYSLIMQCHTSRVHAVDLHPFHWLPA